MHYPTMILINGVFDEEGTAAEGLVDKKNFGESAVGR